MITDADIIKLSKVFVTKQDFSSLHSEVLSLRSEISSLRNLINEFRNVVNELSKRLDDLTIKVDQVYGELQTFREEQSGHFQSHRDINVPWQRLQEAVLVSDVRK